VTSGEFKVSSEIKNYYARLPEKELGMLYTRALRDYREDAMRTEGPDGTKGQGPCKRIRGVPLHLSVAFALRLKEIAGTQIEVERQFYGCDHEGRTQRLYEAGEPMEWWRARDALSSFATMAFVYKDAEYDWEWRYWQTRLDAMEAVKLVMARVNRRKSWGSAIKDLCSFRRELVKASVAGHREHVAELKGSIHDKRPQLEKALEAFGLSIADFKEYFGVDVTYGTDLSHLAREFGGQIRN
jgi:hypothetical protein